MPTMEDYLYNHVNPDMRDYYMIIIDGSGRVEIHRSHPDHTHPYKLLGIITGLTHRIHQGEAIMFFEAGTPVAARVFEWLGVTNTDLNPDADTDTDTGDDDGEAGGGEGDIDTVPGPEHIDPQQSRGIVDRTRDRFTADLCDADYMSMYQ